MPATPNALAAAHRANTIATIARTRAASPAPVPNTEGRAALLEIAALLETAAHSLRTEEPGTWDGIVITNTMDWDASHALRTADEIAAAHPAIGFPPLFSQYVTAPVYGNEVGLPPSLLPGGPVLIAREGGLFARLHAIHGHLRRMPRPGTRPPSWRARSPCTGSTLSSPHPKRSPPTARATGPPSRPPSRSRPRAPPWRCAALTRRTARP